MTEGYPTIARKIRKNMFKMLAGIKKVRTFAPAFEKEVSENEMLREFFKKKLLKNLVV